MGRTDPNSSRRSSWRPLIAFIAILQVLCAAVFIFDIAADVLGLRSVPISWSIREMIEIGAAIGLILGTILGVYAVLQSITRARSAESRIARLSMAFHELMEQRFAEWSLTPAEQDVALFIVKGLSASEIAGLRETSEGTVKAQSASIYRKAGVNGRAQLLGIFIDDLVDPYPVEPS